MVQILKTTLSEYVPACSFEETRITLGMFQTYVSLFDNMHLSTPPTSVFSVTPPHRRCHPDI